MENKELEEMVKYYSNILQKGKIELLDRKLRGITEHTFQRGLEELRAIKNLRDFFEIKLLELESPEEEYNMYCPYQLECNLEKRTCRGGNCKEYQWGK